MYLFIYSLILVLLINYFLNNKKILYNSTGSNHQNFVSDGDIPLSGGLVLILLIYFYLNTNSYYLFIAFILIFLLGFFFFKMELNRHKLLLEQVSERKQSRIMNQAKATACIEL